MFIITAITYQIKEDSTTDREIINRIEGESERGLQTWREYKRKEYAKKNKLKVADVYCNLKYTEVK